MLEIDLLFIGNLAYLKPATQGPHQWEYGDPSGAVDGNIDPAMDSLSCAHPFHNSLQRYDGGVWWQVDLQQTDVIIAVNITNRIDFQGR